MIDLTRSVPPHDADAERAVISCCLTDPAAAPLAIEIVREPARFYVAQARDAFEAIVSLSAGPELWDAVAVRGRLVEAGRAASAEWLLDVLTDPAVPTSANIRLYARRVREKARLRALARAAAKLAAVAYEGGPDAEAASAEHVGAILRILEDRARTTHATMAELALAEAHRIDEGPVSSAPGLATGLPDVDRVLGGLRPQELIVLAARPSMGKTAFACGVMGALALAIPPTRVLFFSLEVPKERIARNMIAQQAGVDTRDLDAGRLTTEETGRAIAAARALHERAPMVIDDGSSADLVRIRARAQATDGVGLIVVDYMQLVNEPAEGRADTMAARVGRVAKGLKALARDLNVPVLALAQLNRGVEAREGHKPRMSDLKESGSIEEAADVVMMLHRAEYYDRKDETLRGKATVQIEKNRNGATGEIPLVFIAKSVRFESVARGGGSHA